jgi:hypothetical protein
VWLFSPIAPAAATRTVETTDRPLPGEEFYRRSDLGRCELIEGTVKERPPATGHSHGRLEFRVAQRLGDFCREREVGEVVVGEVGIYTARDPDGIRAADLLVDWRLRWALYSADAGVSALNSRSGRPSKLPLLMRRATSPGRGVSISAGSVAFTSSNARAGRAFRKTRPAAPNASP